jgi:hypothetical protein
MPDLDVVGVGAWSHRFGNWQELVLGLSGKGWGEDVKLAPGLLPPAVRRRAPVSVKMAIEVMKQACDMAALNPREVATVYCSAMGDMQITDYICQTLAQNPELLSPTQFHNSVHNAATGYWTIATNAHSPATAISAYTYSASMAFLEAAVQAVDEELPVLLVTEEVQAPPALRFACPTNVPFAAAMVLAPVSEELPALARLRFETRAETVEWTGHSGLPDQLANIPSATLLSILAALAEAESFQEARCVSLPLSPGSHVDVSISASAASRRDHA